MKPVTDAPSIVSGNTTVVPNTNVVVDHTAFHRGKGWNLWSLLYMKLGHSCICKTRHRSFLVSTGGMGTHDSEHKYMPLSLNSNSFLFKAGELQEGVWA